MQQFLKRCEILGLDLDDYRPKGRNLVDQDPVTCDLLHYRLYRFEFFYDILCLTWLAAENVSNDEHKLASNDDFVPIILFHGVQAVNPQPIRFIIFVSL
jgi:hypothetical protein